MPLAVAGGGKEKFSAFRTENQMHMKVSCVQQNIDDKIQGLIQKSIPLSHVLDVKHMLIKVTAYMNWELGSCS